MKALRIAVIGLFITGLLAIGGCAKNEAVKKAEEMADAACKCEDNKCVAESLLGFSKWMMDNKDIKGTEGDLKKIKAATEKATECGKKLAAAPAAAPKKAEEKK